MQQNATAVGAPPLTTLQGELQRSFPKSSGFKGSLRGVERRDREEGERTQRETGREEK